jgi:hypothetical protein
VWIDKELNWHSGPLISSFPDPIFSYNYYENGYKLNKVAKVTILYSSGFKKSEKNYNGDYFLVREFKQVQYGEELHRYSYDENYLVVTDSIERINFIYDETQANPYTKAPGKQIGTDTVYGVEKRVFDHEKKLISIHLHPTYNANGGIKKKLEYPYGDSLFYSYDTCGNRNGTRAYYSGQESRVNYAFEYASASVNQVYIVYVNYSGPWEEWQFNAKGQLLVISARHESIFIEYDKNRIDKYISYFTLMDERIKATYSYLYNSDGKLREVHFTYNSDRYRMEGSSDRVKINWHKNGLIKSDQLSNTYFYSYRKRK